MRISLQPAFVLHTRPYRETSVIAEFFTKEHGRITAVARGVRQVRSTLRPLLQPFIPLLISWQGKSELMNLQTAEAQEVLQRPQGECLLSGLYLNELLMRALPKGDSYSRLYTIYHQTLIELQGSELKTRTLRLFEKHLLKELGYGLQLDEPSLLLADAYYRFHPEYGFRECAEDPEQHTIFLGKSLLSLANETLDDETSLRDAKRLMRIALAPILGKHKLQSRRLYIPTKKTEVETT